MTEHHRKFRQYLPTNFAKFIQPCSFLAYFIRRYFAHLMKAHFIKAHLTAKSAPQSLDHYFKCHIQCNLGIDSHHRLQNHGFLRWPFHFDGFVNIFDHNSKLDQVFHCNHTHTHHRL